MYWLPVYFIFTPGIEWSNRLGEIKMLCCKVCHSQLVARAVTWRQRRAEVQTSKIRQNQKHRSVFLNISSQAENCEASECWRTVFSLVINLCRRILSFVKTSRSRIMNWHSPRGSLGHHRWFNNQFPPLFSVSHCPLGLGELQACLFRDVVLPPLLLSALQSSTLSLCLARWFWPDLMNGRHVNITAICFSLRWSGVLSCGPIACWILARTSSLVKAFLYDFFFVCILRFHGYFHISMASILPCSSAVRVRDSQAWKIS